MLAAGIYWIVSNNLYQTVQVDGPSMYPTLHNADKYILNRWVYHLRDPRPNEIVVLKDPQDSVFEVKRVIATQGESVYIRKGKVYVNGTLLHETYLDPLTRTYSPEKTGDVFICCGRNQYYVLGDNRDVSRDSRYFGPVRRENILGKLIF
jgi:signal peptidase I